MPGETRLPIMSALDIVTARQMGRSLATELGFEGVDLTLIAAAISEVARNIVEYAASGEILFQIMDRCPDPGLRIVASDQGPGIPDVNQAMQHGYSTRSGLGVGLPGAKLLMDEFHIESNVGVGTTVTMTKWLR